MAVIKEVDYNEMRETLSTAIEKLSTILPIERLQFTKQSHSMYHLSGDN